MAHRAALALALLALAPVLAGCTAPEAPQPRARAGDFAVLDLVAHGAQGQEVLNLTAQRAVLGDAVPPRLPEGWDANGTLPLPRAVVRALEGLRPGAVFATPLAAPEEGFGPWDANLTIAAPRVQRLSRVLDLPWPLPLQDGKLRWANASWDFILLEQGNSTAKVRLGAGPGPNATLELPDYWNQGYQLWRSRVVPHEGEGLVVEHLPEAGRTVLVGGQPYRVEAPEGQALADGNHPLAREALRFQGTLRSLAFPPGRGPPTAPDALLIDAGDSTTRFNVSDLRGKPALVDFFASWCVTCKQQAPILARAAEAHGANLTIVSVTIDPTDTPERIAAFREGVPRDSLLAWGRPLGANWTFAFDPTGQAAKGFSVLGIPRFVLLDHEGRIRATGVGVHTWPQLQSDLLPVLAEAEAARAESAR
jgi:cytochrome c biogenesis protein CcmG, thiol:disulfide interchange protein DsbE